MTEKRLICLLFFTHGKKTVQSPKMDPPNAYMFERRRVIFTIFFVISLNCDSSFKNFLGVSLINYYIWQSNL